jgi:hypothetical protein
MKWRRSPSLSRVVEPSRVRPSSVVVETIASATTTGLSDYGVCAMRSIRRPAWTFACAVALVFATAGRVSACPNCKEAVSAQPAEAARMADGFNWSILLMLGVPFSMLGAGAFAVRRAVKLGVLPEM